MTNLIPRRLFIINNLKLTLRRLHVILVNSKISQIIVKFQIEKY